MSANYHHTDENVLILPGAVVVGDVSFGPGCCVWFNAVLRADVDSIRVGEKTNIQDNATLHTGHGFPIRIGAGCIVAHNAIVHGCTIGDNTLVGMGAIVMNGAVVGSNCIIAAGALVTQGMTVPDGSMVMGAPAKIRRALTPEEIEGLRRGAQFYFENKENYR